MFHLISHQLRHIRYQPHSDSTKNSCVQFCYITTHCNTIRIYWNYKKKNTNNNNKYSNNKNLYFVKLVWPIFMTKIFYFPYRLYSTLYHNFFLYFLPHNVNYFIWENRVCTIVVRKRFFSFLLSQDEKFTFVQSFYRTRRQQNYTIIHHLTIRK